MKPAGITLALVSTAILIGLVVLDASAREGARVSVVVVTAGIDLLLLLGWLLVFTPAERTAGG